MRSTGEVMGRDRSFGLAFLKAALGAGIRLPENGNAFLSVHDGDKDALLPLARELDALGFHLLATAGTAKALGKGGLSAEIVLKVNEGRPNIVDLMINGRGALAFGATVGLTALAFGSFPTSTARATLGITLAFSIAGAAAGLLRPHA